MQELTSYERIKRVINHQEADRVPITDWAWESTIANWTKQGMPYGADWKEFFDVDKIAWVTFDNIDTSPRYTFEILEETDTYRIVKDMWGVTKKDFKPCSSTPMFLDYTIRDRDSWYAAKDRMKPTEDRIDWDIWKNNYQRWRANGYWIQVSTLFGFDTVSSYTIGTENALIALIDDPEWMKEMFDHGCDLALALLDMIWERGYEFDEFNFCDDLGYRNGLLFSPELWHKLVRPYHKRTIDWAHEHGIPAHLHSCGRVRELIPAFIELGLDTLNPLETKAGMDPIALKHEYGEKICLRGGFDIMNWNSYEKAEADIKEKLPVLKESGGYIFASDHSIADDVSVENYIKIVALAKEVGKY